MNINLSKNMSKNLITVSENMKVEEALMIMKNHHFRHLPVVNDKNEIVGIVSDRDLYKSLNNEEIILSQIMTRNIFKFDVKTNMKELVEKMIKLKISAFLITSNGDIAGIITTEDMLLLLSQLLESAEESVSVLEQYLVAALGVTEAVKNPNLIT